MENSGILMRKGISFHLSKLGKMDNILNDECDISSQVVLILTGCLALLF